MISHDYNENWLSIILFFRWNVNWFYGGGHELDYTSINPFIRQCSFLSFITSLVPGGMNAHRDDQTERRDRRRSWK